MYIFLTGIKIKLKLLRMERVFLNLFIYQKERTNLFNPVGSIWDVDMLSQISFNKPTKAKVTLYIRTNEKNLDVNQWQDYVNGAYAVLKDFDANLFDLMGDLNASLTPHAPIAATIDQSLINKYIRNKNNDEERRVDNFKTPFGDVF